MSDLTVQISQCRIAFSPDGGEELLLLDVGDMADAAPELPLEPQASTHELIARDYVAHAARGNAEPRLTFDVYRRCMSRQQAQAEPLRLWRKLAAAPSGSLRFQTAFAGAKTLPAIDWIFRATLASYSPRLLTESASPFAHANGVHLAFEFLVTDPKDAY